MYRWYLFKAGTPKRSEGGGRRLSYPTEEIWAQAIVIAPIGPGLQPGIDQSYSYAFLNYFLHLTCLGTSPDTILSRGWGLGTTLNLHWLQCEQPRDAARGGSIPKGLPSTVGRDTRQSVQEHSDTK